MVLSIASRVFSGLLFCACSATTPAQEAFYPSLRAHERSPYEWVRQLERGDGDPVRALWCLYYSGQPSAEVHDAVWRRFRRGSPAERRAAEAILQLWGQTFQPLNLGEYGHNIAGTRGQRPGPPLDGVGTTPGDLYACPVKLMPGTNDELWRQMQGGSQPFARSAAATLIARRADIDRVLQSQLSWTPLDSAWLSPRAGSFEAWALDQVGDATGRAVGFLLQRTGEEGQVKDLLELAEKHPASMGPAVGGIAAWIDHPRLGRRALHALNRTLFGSRRLGHEVLHSQSVFLFAEPRLERTVAGALQRALAPHPRRWPLELLEAIEYLGMNSKAVREACTPRLEDALEMRQARHERVLRILCHFVSGSKDVRHAYLESLNRRTDFRAGAFEDMPCWKNHDRGTMSALVPVLRRMANKREILTQLDFGGLHDTRDLPVLADLFEDMGEEGMQIRRMGFLGMPVVKSTDRLDERVHKLAVSIATGRVRGRPTHNEERRLAELLTGRRRHGRSGRRDHLASGLQHATELGLVTPDFQEAALSVLAWGHNANPQQLEWAERLLERAELSPRTAAILEHHRRGRRPRSGPRLGGVRYDSEAMQFIPELRLALYGGQVERIPDLLELTTLLRRDEGYLLAALYRGGAEVRGKALALVRDHGLRSRPFREALEQLQRDPHGPNRRLAEQILHPRRR